MFALIISSTPNLSVMLQVKHFGQPVKYMIHVPDQIFQPQSMVVKRGLTNRANVMYVIICNKAFIMRHLSRETYSEAQIISAHLAAIPETPGQAPSLLR